jgi:FAD synthetase
MSFADSHYLDAKNSIKSTPKTDWENVRPLVMCFGTFDIFHKWHEYYLRESMKLGKSNVVVIARDHRVISGKWKTPIHSENERRANVQSSFPLSQVILGDEHDIFAPLRTYQPDILAFGYDQRVPEEKIHELFPTMKIVRIDGFETDVWKSSLLRNKL